MYSYIFNNKNERQELIEVGLGFVRSFVNLNDDKNLNERISFRSFFVRSL